MTIALVSCGPSWIETWPGRSGYDEVIGVRAVASWISCDWWSLCDVCVWTNVLPVGKPKIWCPDMIRTKMSRMRAGEMTKREPSPGKDERGVISRVAAKRWDSWPSEKIMFTHAPKPPIGDGGPSFWRYSGCAALALLWRMAPEEAHVYGMDLDGDADANGATWGCHTDQRWREERRLAGRLVRVVRDAGVRIRWMLASGEADQHPLIE